MSTTEQAVMVDDGGAGSDAPEASPPDASTPDASTPDTNVTPPPGGCTMSSQCASGYGCFKPDAGANTCEKIDDVRDPDTSIDKCGRDVIPPQPWVRVTSCTAYYDPAAATPTNFEEFTISVGGTPMTSHVFTGGWTNKFEGYFPENPPVATFRAGRQGSMTFCPQNGPCDGGFGCMNGALGASMIPWMEVASGDEFYIDMNWCKEGEAVAGSLCAANVDCRSGNCVAATPAPPSEHGDSNNTPVWTGYCAP